MNAPQWPLEELIDLYRSFLEMRQRASLDERRELSFRLVLHRASLVRLEKAAIACTFCPLDLRADILQEATLLLVESLSAESLAYADQGPDEFASWYWTVGCNACRRAANGYRDKPGRSLAYIDPEHLVQCPESRRIEEHPFDRLTRMIARLPEGPEKKVILDWGAGLTVDESARRRGISPRTVDLLRQRGRRLVLEMCVGDASDGD